MSKKLIAAVLAVIVIACVAVSGTFAYLFFKGETISNTFTIGDVDVTFTETTGDSSTHEHGILPGKDTAKNPTVTVGKGSEDSYVFVELQEVCTASGKKFSDYLTYTVGTDFTELTGAGLTGHKVYYYFYTADKNNDKVLSVLKDNKVTATNFDNAAKTALEGKELSLNINAGAIQNSADFTGATANAKALAAWNALVGGDKTLFSLAN